VGICNPASCAQLSAAHTISTSVAVCLKGKCQCLTSSICAWVSQVVSFPPVSPPKLCIRLSCPLILATCPAHLMLLDLIIRTILGEKYRSLSSSLCSFLHSPITSSLSGLKFSSNPYSEASSVYVSPSKWTTKFYTHKKQQAKL